MAWYYYVVMGFTLLFGSPSNLPLGLPPLPEDPLLAKVAPEECLWYMSWAGTARADANSTEPTERLLAEADVRRLIVVLYDLVVDNAREEAGDDPGAKLLADELPALLTTLFKRPAALFNEKNVPGDDGSWLRGGAIVNLGDRAAAVEKSLLRLKKHFIKDAAPMKEIAGTMWHVISLPEPPVKVFWSVRGRYLIVGVGQSSVEGILRRAKTAPPEWLTDLRRRGAVKRISLVSYYNMRENLKTERSTPPDPKGIAILSALGIDQLTTVTSVAGLDERGYVKRTFYELDGVPRGIFAPAALKPLTRDDLSVIPRDVSFAAVARINGDDVFRGVFDVLKQMDERTFGNAVLKRDEFERSLGFKFSDDLLQSLGDVWRVYGDREGGWLTLVVDVRDANTLRAALGKLEANLVSTPRRDPAVKRKPSERISMIRKFEFRGETITFLNKSPPQLMLVAPAWSLVDDKLIVSLYPQGIKAYLSRGKDAPTLADHAKVAGTLSGGRTLAVSFIDTKRNARELYPVVQVFAQYFSSEARRKGLPIDISQFPSATSILPHLASSIRHVERTDGGLMSVSRTTLPGHGDALTVAATAGVALLPAIQKVRAAAQKDTSKSNMRNLGIAIQNFCTDHRGMLPTAAVFYGKEKPRMSWRVHLLPYIEQKDLYDQFKLDEPWDSKHNKKLIGNMPQLYEAPTSDVADEGKTVYLAVTGEGAAFQKDEKVGLEMPDGTSGTIMLVEANDERAVIWTKPDDWEFNPDKPMAGLGGQYPGGFLAVFVDAAVRQIPLTSDKKKVKALMIRNDGITVNPDALEPE